jgi:group I intron endonuclease
MTTGIYEIVNKVNGNKYIGSSVNIEERIKRHFRLLVSGKHHSPHLQHAFGAYGENSFCTNVLELCDVDSLIIREQFYIDTQLPEYNVSPTAGRVSGIVRSESYRKKQSVSQSGKVIPKETRVRISAGMRGKKNSLGVKRELSEETKKKISNTLLGHSVSEETRVKISQKTFRHTEEARRKISAAGMGRVISQETIEKRKATRARNKAIKQDEARP